MLNVSLYTGCMVSSGQDVDELGNKVLSIS